MLVGSSGIIGSQIKNIPNIDFIFFDRSHADLTDFDKTNHVIANLPKVDVLIFLVGLAHKRDSNNSFKSFEKNNYTSLVNLMSVLKQNNKIPKKIIFTSSISVYGERKDTNIYSENTSLKPNSAYARTKKMAEEYLLENYKTKSWILRLAPVYYPKFSLNINRRTKLFYFFYKVGKGFKKLSLCNIKNVIKSINSIIDEIVPSGVYNISDNVEYSYNDLLKWQKARFVISIPNVFMNGLFKIGVLFKNNFLIENIIKLTSDNLYPSDKIRSFINLNSNLIDNQND
tara:strand:- start:23267 stop:24121 length:855 start_codon:yes stop_codon:yes gene_type:complete